MKYKYDLLSHIQQPLLGNKTNIVWKTHDSTEVVAKPIKAFWRAVKILVLKNIVN